MNRKILLVDDEIDAVDLLKTLLSDYDVAVAYDGKTALEYIRAEKPALVILDVLMPVMGGVEVLREIMRMDTQPLVLMLTGVKDVQTITKSMEIGVFAYMTKPFMASQLKDQVKEAMSFLDQKAAG